MEHRRLFMKYVFTYVAATGIKSSPLYEPERKQKDLERRRKDRSSGSDHRGGFGDNTVLLLLSFPLLIKRQRTAIIVIPKT
jgi:hypothetical protein